MPRTATPPDLGGAGGAGVHYRALEALYASAPVNALFESRLETELMALFRDEGDDAAFQALYDYTRGRMLVWIAGLLGSRRSAPDPHEILQDTYVNIYRYARSFRNEDARSFRA
jgi:hypothetical protein